jgi:hypothetical protein
MPKEPARDFPRDDSNQKTTIAVDGLRYVSRANGSPFDAGAGTQSCFLCGKHRARSSLKSRKLIGRNRLVCAEPCTKAATAGTKSAQVPA